MRHIAKAQGHIFEGAADFKQSVEVAESIAAASGNIKSLVSQAFQAASASIGSGASLLSVGGSGGSAPSIGGSRILTELDLSSPTITVELTGDVTGSGNTTLENLANGTITIATSVGATNAVDTFNGRIGDVVLISSDVTDALTYVPLSNTSPLFANNIVGTVAFANVATTALSSNNSAYLNGQLPSFYMDLANATGTLPVARLSGTYTITATQANNATYLNGQAASYYSNYINLTNVPTTFTPSSHSHPISDITGLQTALDGKQASLGYTAENTANKDAINGYAGLDASGKLLTSVLPDLAISDTSVVASEVAMLALTAQKGDVAIRTDLSKTYILSSNSPTTLADWKEMLSPASPVLSVAGLVGNISAVALKSALSLTISDTSGLQAALDAKASLSGTAPFTGQITVRQDPSYGSVTLISGSASLPGYAEFISPGGTRRGYIGWGTGADQLVMHSENGWNWNFTQRPLFNGATPWDSANFDPAIKANLASPSLTGDITVTGTGDTTVGTFSSTGNAKITLSRTVAGLSTLTLAAYSSRGAIESDQSLTLAAGSAEAVRILGSGNVGINNINALEKLDVVGNINIDAASTYKQGGTTMLATSSSYFYTAIGLGACRVNLTSGVISYNTAVGYQSLYSLSLSGIQNTAVGLFALSFNTTASYNTAVGSYALRQSTTGGYNNAIGYAALTANLTGIENNAMGYSVLANATAAQGATAVGSIAGLYNTTASYSTFIGWKAGRGLAAYSTVGTTSIGAAAGMSGTTGSDYGTLIGYYAGYGISTGSRNILIGASTISASQNQVTTGSRNVAIGDNVAMASATGSDQLVIGNLIYGTGLTGTGATISPSGKIGIGIKAPVVALDVLGEVGASTAMNIGGTDVLSGSATSIATVAALRARTGVRAPFVRLLSGAADNGGLFEWIAASTTTDDGALYIKETAVATGRWHRVIQDRSVLVDWFGAVPNSSGTDNAAAINAAEAAAALLGGTVRFKEGVDYYFKAALVGNRDRLSWRGYNTRLIYNGVSTTIDLVTIGNDSTSKFGAVVMGLAICSLTTMTAGYALRTPLLARSVFHLDNIQGQDFYQANGNKLYNGIYADRVDCVEFWANACIAQNKGVTVRGAVGSGPKADCWVNIGKIGWCAIGLHCGGAFGGLFLGPQTTFIINGINMLVDQTLSAETNREIFATGTIFDVSTNASEANIVLNDAGSVLYTFTGVWIASSSGKGVWIKQHSGKLAMAGIRIFNCTSDAFRSDVGGASLVVCSGAQIHDNGGYGFNMTVASHNLTQTGTSFGANVSGDVNDTYKNVIGPPTGVVEYFGVADGTGQLTISHGDSDLPNKLIEVQGFYENGTGVAKPLVMQHIDGGSLVFVTEAPAAGLRCRVYIRYRLSGRWA